MNERDNMQVATGMVASMAKKALAEEMPGPDVSVSLDGPAPVPFVIGKHTPMLHGHIATFHLESTDPAKYYGSFGQPSNTVFIDALPDGAEIVLPARLRGTWYIGWWGVQPYEVHCTQRQDLMRFSIGGDGTPGSGYLVRVYLKKGTDEVGVLLPDDPEAARFIRYYEEECRGDGLL